MSDVKKFPGHRWSPEGETRVFNDAADVPEGWTDFHPDSKPAVETSNAPPAETPKPATQPSRQQIIADLQRRSVVFQRNATTAALYQLLVAEVERSEA